MPLSTELVGVEPYVFLTISACTDRKINRNGVKTSVNYSVYILYACTSYEACPINIPIKCVKNCLLKLQTF